MSNHLGNVLAIVSDALIDDAPNVVSATDYYAFGQEMVGRTYASEDYRYGFNGKENDREWGESLIQDYGMRLYNPALCRFLSVDPLSQSYPWNSTYAFAEGDVISCVDLDGGEKQEIIDAFYWAGSKTATLVKETAGGLLKLAVTPPAVLAYQAAKGGYQYATGGGLYKDATKTYRVVKTTGKMVYDGAYRGITKGKQSGYEVTNEEVNEWNGVAHTATKGLAKNAALTAVTAPLGLLGEVSTVTRAEAAIIEGTAVEVSTATQHVWSLKYHLRGEILEKMLGGNLPNCFKTIDKYESLTGCATSIKSIDLAAKSYVNSASLLKSTLKKYVDDLSNFTNATGSNRTIGDAISPVNSKALDLVIPDGPISAAHQTVINDITTYASGKNITVNLHQISEVPK